MHPVIVIPFHSPEMKPEEKSSLIQCARIFGGKRDIVFAVPESLDCGAYIDIVPNAVIRRFPDPFFVSVSGYNHLLLTADFYRCFEDYDCMLIYQLDGWVFRDELDLWCAKGYEYIGGPFFMKDGKHDLPVVGNGGVSLRRVEAMLRVLNGTERKMFPRKLLLRFFRTDFAEGNFMRCVIPLLKIAGVLPNSRGRFLSHIRKQQYNSEDVVFYFLSREFTPDGLIMPSLEEAAHFSVDAAPERFFDGLPFCCHAWMKNGPEFWKKYIDLEIQK